MALHAAQWIPFFRPRPMRNETPLIRGIGYHAVMQALEDAGFWILREGVHVVMTNGTRIVTIPCDDPVHALTLGGIVRDAGLTVEQFRQLL